MLVLEIVAGDCATVIMRGNGKAVLFADGRELFNFDADADNDDLVGWHCEGCGPESECLTVRDGSKKGPKKRGLGGDVL